MANTIVYDIDEMAQISLKKLVPHLIHLDAFSKNLSDSRLSKGKQLIVEQFTYPTAASKDFTGVAGGLYTEVTDIVENEIKVPLDKHLYKSHLLTQDELQLCGVKQGNIEMQAMRVLNDMMQYFLGFFTLANFPNTSIVAAAAWDSDNVSLVRDAVAALNWAPAQMGEANNRRMISNSAFYGALTRDPDVKQVFASGQNQVIEQGILPQVFGFDQIELNSLPANGEDLGVIATHVNALAIATGAITPAGTFTGDFATATDEKTGFTICVRRFTENGSGAEYFVTEVLAGGVVADPDQAFRITAS